MYGKINGVSFTVNSSNKNEICIETNQEIFGAKDCCISKEN